MANKQTSAVPQKTATRQEKKKAALLALAARGPLTPDRVIDAAKDPRSPLHTWFTWDIKTAAQAYWREQARELIRSVEVTVLVEDRPVKVSYFVRDLRKEIADQGYMELDDLQKSPEWARKHVQQELTAVIERLQRAEGYAAVLRIQDQVATVVRSVRKLSARVSSASVGATP
jgi:hypothetical protein